MNYQEALQFLESPSRFSPRLGLERIRAFLEELGSPQEKFPSVLIGGTSGKGSSCKMIEAVLTKAGHKVGLFTKPHLQSYRERISLGGELISKEDLVSLVEEIIPFAEKIGKTELGFPTYFEMGVALAFKYFAQKKVDLAVVEVGMGGRFDATNVLKPLLCGITKIGLDHQEFLGDTLEKIAFEKAGIIKPKTPVVFANQEPEVFEVLKKVAEEKEAPIFPGYGNAEGPLFFNLKGQCLNLKGESKVFEKIFLPLLGKHQIENASFALKILEILKKSGFFWEEKHLREGLEGVTWPGRMEIVAVNPILLIDGAHNPNKAEALIKGVSEYFKFKRLLLILGVSKDKDLRGIVAEFSKQKPFVFATAYKSERAFPPAEIKNCCTEFNLPCVEVPSVPSAVKEALRIAGRADLILATGSIYVAGEVRDIYFPID